MLTAAFLFAILDGLIKLLGPPFRVWDIAFYRFACGLAILVPVFSWKRNPFKGHNPKLLIIRGIAGSCAFLSLVTAIRLIPISTAMVLFFSFPAFAAFFSPLIFKEPIAWTEILCVFAALVGVAVLFDFQLQGAILGQIMALVGGGFAGLTVSIIKKLREKNGPVVIYLYFCLLGTLVSLPAFAANPQIPRVTLEWVMLGGIVCSSLIAQLLMNQGFRYCKSWEGGLFLMAEVLFTSILGIVFLDEPMSWRFWIGGFLILGSAIALNRGNARRISHRGIASAAPLESRRDEHPHSSTTGA
ncbi:MAG: DMT family transporter [Deltaproteobacteria bacterium]|nr:MAG: DMT family transporter [Deltaproteobacteria bacterium]